MLGEPVEPRGNTMNRVLLRVVLALIAMTCTMGSSCDNDHPAQDLSAKPLQAPTTGAAATNALVPAYGMWRGKAIEGAGGAFESALAKLTLNLTEGHLTLSGPSPRGGAGGKADPMQASRDALATGGSDAQGGPEAIDSDYRVVGVEGGKVTIGWGTQMAKLELRDGSTLALTDVKKGYTILFSKGISGQ